MLQMSLEQRPSSEGKIYGNNITLDAKPADVVAYLDAMNEKLLEIAKCRESAHIKELEAKKQLNAAIMVLNDCKDTDYPDMAETAFAQLVKRKTSLERHKYEIAHMERMNIDKRQEVLMEAINIQKQKMRWIGIEYKNS